VAQQQAVLASMRAVAAEEEEEDGDDDGNGTQSRARKRGAMRDSGTMPQSPLPLNASSSSSASASTSSLSSPHKLAAVEALHAEIARLRSQLSDASSSSSSSSAADLKAAAEQWRRRFESAQRDADERATALTAARAGKRNRARWGSGEMRGNHKHSKLYETFLNEHEPILSHTQPLCLGSSISDLCALCFKAHVSQSLHPRRLLCCVTIIVV
jgi:hypothetical protein